MDYRDERDALRGRVENLEQDLAGAREELKKSSGDDRQQRIDELEKQVAEARRLVDQLGGQLDQLRGGPKPSGNGRVLTFLLIAAGLGTVSWLVLGRSQPAPPPMVVHAPPQPVEVAQPVDPARPVEPPKVVEVPAPPPEPAPVRPVVRATARWQAKVAKVNGLPVAPGTTCPVDATLEGGAGKIRVRSLTVSCGGREVYNSEDPLNGMSMSGSGVEEDAGDRAGTFLYALDYQDKGSRTGKRSQVSINSIAKSASVWSDSAPAFRIDLAMPYQSEPVTGEPLLESTAHTLRRVATVTQVSGSSPVRTGARCSLRIAPLASGGRCLARLRCGAEMLYGKGTTGVAECTQEDGKITRVLDKNPTSNGGDPRIDIDPAAGRLVISDEIGPTKWSATMALREK